MEVFLYNSTVCRLCGEENDSGSLLYTPEENNPSLCEVINSYMPIKVKDDGQLPRTICPGCTIQLEATVEFLNLIINGQKVIRELHQREREYKKNLLKVSDDDVITEKIVYEINTDDGIYQVEHPVALQVAGLEKPKRKRGRPPKKPKIPEEVSEEVQVQEKVKKKEIDDEASGKRRRKTPTRFRETVQGKELDRIFKEEGVTDGEDSDGEKKRPIDSEAVASEPKEPEVIGHLETSGELVVVVKGKGRGRPKGRMRPTREECAICGMQFSCVGRYMCHVAAHGPVRYQCRQCGQAFPTRLTFTSHQQLAGHQGQDILPHGPDPDHTGDNNIKEEKVEKQSSDTECTKDLQSNSMPDLGLKLEDNTQLMKSLASNNDNNAPINVIDSSPTVDSNDKITADPENNEEDVSETLIGPKGKVKLKCSQCDKMFSSKQSRSMHIKAVHEGSRAYQCSECAARFAYPRSLALHQLKHRRHARPQPRYACDLCGKVLNHPSSVVYHKEAQHAGQRYVCNKCGKQFKHKQLLHRHQLVHSQDRPYSCKTCDATFKTKANLLNHQLLHTGVKKFSCEICKHKFAHKTSLILHMRWHTGSKPFVCKVCGKSFSQKGNLSEHERIHTGEKPYECSECSRRFTTSSQYRLHARRHLPERAHACQTVPKKSWRGLQCAVCERAFSERWALLKHMRRHAGDARPNHGATHKQNKQVHKQISLLVPEKQPPVEQPPIELAPMEPHEIIYVTYDVDDSEPAFHLLDPEQAASLEEDKVTTCELYSGSSLLVPPKMESEPVEEPDHIQVTDEQGNPLHFTMQDGTQLAITSIDGKTLQVITQDGQTIPVEINGYAEEEVNETPDTIVHQQNLRKETSSVASPVAQYFTLV